MYPGCAVVGNWIYRDKDRKDTAQCSKLVEAHAYHDPTQHTYVTGSNVTPHDLSARYHYRKNRCCVQQSTRTNRKQRTWTVALTVAMQECSHNTLIPSQLAKLDAGCRNLEFGGNRDSSGSVTAAAAALTISNAQILHVCDRGKPLSSSCDRRSTMRISTQACVVGVARYK